MSAAPMACPVASVWSLISSDMWSRAGVRREEFTSMLEDNMGNMDLFHYDIPPVDDEVYKTLKKGAPTSPSKALWFNEMD